jgi:hypothetical protein
MEVDMDDKQMEQAQKTVHDLVDSIENVMEGKQIGCIIPALIFLLASLHDEDVLPKETYINEINKSLRKYLDNDEGEAAWLH